MVAGVSSKGTVPYCCLSFIKLPGAGYSSKLLWTNFVFPIPQTVIEEKKWLKGNTNILVRKMCIQTSEERRSYLLNSGSLKSCMRRKLLSAAEFSTKFLFSFKNIIIVFIHIYPWGPPNLLYNGYKIKQDGCDVDYPPPYSTRPSWSVIRWSLPYMMQNILMPLNK